MVGVAEISAHIALGSVCETQCLHIGTFVTLCWPNSTVSRRNHLGLRVA